FRAIANGRARTLFPRLFHLRLHIPAARHKERRSPSSGPPAPDRGEAVAPCSRRSTRARDLQALRRAPLPHGRIRAAPRRGDFCHRWPQPSCTSPCPARSAGPRETPCGARGPSPPGAAGAAGRPTSVKESINPGYTIRPLPSITQASGGIVAFVPTAVISPRVITIVPFSSGGPETG